MKRRLIITVDGPAGAGKSTVSKSLAEKLSYVYLDTGAIYRAIAYQADREGLSDDKEEELRALCDRTVISLGTAKGGVKISVNGIDVTDDIRTPRISLLASRMSAFPAVRSSLLSIQRKMAEGGGVVAEGRDMGTVVFPEADMKFFLEAGVDERARRRHVELRGKGFDASYEEVRSEIVIRDRQDRERDISPLKPADDAIIIDSTDVGVEEVVGNMMDHLKKRGGMP